MTKYLSFLFMLLLSAGMTKAAEDYKQDPAYQALRDSMHHAFNDGDSTRFFTSVKALEAYLEQQGDLHAYYTQRCNEIVFLMNRQKIYEAYKLAHQLSYELREKKLDREMYMAYNMMGHIYRYCGNKEEAKRCFTTVIEMMEEGGYRESMPPIYMNIVNVVMDEDPQEAMKLLNKAAEIAAETSPERVFDIETRRTVAYYNMGDKEKFLEGYKAYKEGVAKGLSSVHGRTMEVYYQACLGNIDEAVRIAEDELSDDGYSTIANLYKEAGRWKDAYEALKKEVVASDSINGVILSNSMDGIRDELRIYEAERKAVRSRMLALTAVSGFLLLLVLALAYITFSRRRHMKQLNNAYQHALEADKMKAAFIQNVSHEVRTPLNIISGFSQVIADPDFSAGIEERQDIAQMMKKNTHLITSLIDEMLILSQSEAETEVKREDQVEVNTQMRDLLREFSDAVSSQVRLGYESQLADSFTVQTNSNMLRNIVYALVDNAVKNTGEGTVTLKAGTDGRMLTLAVEDTGCGIPASESEHIFDRFVKLDTFKEGIGLGLPLARKLSRQLGGDVTLDTSWQHGARFIVTLPL